MASQRVTEHAELVGHLALQASPACVFVRVSRERPLDFARQPQRSSDVPLLVVVQSLELGQGDGDQPGGGKAPEPVDRRNPFAGRKGELPAERRGQRFGGPALTLGGCQSLLGVALRGRVVAEHTGDLGELAFELGDRGAGRRLQGVAPLGHRLELALGLGEPPCRLGALGLGGLNVLERACPCLLGAFEPRDRGPQRRERLAQAAEGGLDRAELVAAGRQVDVGGVGVEGVVRGSLLGLCLLLAKMSTGKARRERGKRCLDGRQGAVGLTDRFLGWEFRELALELRVTPGEIGKLLLEAGELDLLRRGAVAPVGESGAPGRLARGVPDEGRGRLVPGTAHDAVAEAAPGAHPHQAVAFTKPDRGEQPAHICLGDAGAVIDRRHQRSPSAGTPRAPGRRRSGSCPRCRAGRKVIRADDESASRKASTRSRRFGFAPVRSSSPEVAHLGGLRGARGTIALMPTQAQLDFFVRWSEAARREDRVVDASLSMEQRLDEAARLSVLASELRDAAARSSDADVRPT